MKKCAKPGKEPREAIFRHGNVNWKAEHLLLWVGCGFAIHRLQEIK